MPSRWTAASAATSWPLVVEINYEAMEVPEIVNEDPLSEGWLLKVELTSGLEFDDLFTEEEYEEHLSEEEDLEED